MDVADHGAVDGDTISGTYDESRQVLADLAAAVGVDHDDVIEMLEVTGQRGYGAAELNEIWRRRQPRAAQRVARPCARCG